MKKILITGKNSYIGGMFKKWVSQWPEKYHVNEISVHGEDWKQVNFNSYDVVFHVAAIVHKKETPVNIDLYYKVNRDLAVEVAKKAKEDDVNHFIFMSTMNVYGLDKGVITEETPCKPKTAYGKSKLEAEKLINKLQDDSFAIAIIRPPMVYGPNTVGNYVRLSKFARRSPVFPEILNKRSMIYVGNLSEFIRLLIEKDERGTFFPQNKEYVSTLKLVREISKIHNKTLYTTKLFNSFIKLFNDFKVIEKVFGDLIYDQERSFRGWNYEVFTFEESIKVTEILKDK